MNKEIIIRPIDDANNLQRQIYRLDTNFELGGFELNNLRTVSRIAPFYNNIYFFEVASFKGLEDVKEEMIEFFRAKLV